ncbi:tripartite motif-containing protein 2-like [Saccostrea cucullata]|uniref:tripartite motif-containing protein 2-like n=1 Tax=Saccostrea cuccullata TaxID=36930 RepID=UPI002ED0F39F
MDPRLSAQDVLCCDLCETPVPPMYCDFCHVKLCKACVGEHLSDLSKEHKVVPYKQKGTTPICPTHAGKLCELHCKECVIPVCSLCVSDKHKGHTFMGIVQIFNDKKEEMKNDIQELEKCLCPRYEEITSEMIAEKSVLDGKYGKLTTAVTKHGEDWHREINIIVNKQKSEIDEMKTKHLAALNEQEKEIKKITSEVKQCIVDLKKILDSNDISLTSAYKSRNTEFRSLPPKVNVSLPSFSPNQINTKQLHQMFGSLSALSITTEKHGYAMKTPVAVSCPPVKPLLDQPKLITIIDTGYDRLFSVTCLSDEEILTKGDATIMKLYNLQGKLLKSIKTKSGNSPEDVAVTRSGDLVYTDCNTRTVNMVKNKQIQEVIRLKGWRPYNVCSTSSGDFLVTMNSDDGEQSKVICYSVRYSGSTEKQTIQFDSEGKPLYSSGNYIKFISENRNLDICVADWRASAVVVVNQAGKLRFRYTGHPSTTKRIFDPRGITTDSHSQILIADHSYNCIHILDQDGQFLRYIDNCDLQSPWGLCVDTRDNLFVAECYSGKVKKIKYM